MVDHEALLQVTEHIVEHANVGGVSLLGVVGGPHDLRLQKCCVVSQGGCRRQQTWGAMPVIFEFVLDVQGNVQRVEGKNRVVDQSKDGLGCHLCDGLVEFEERV